MSDHEHEHEHEHEHGQSGVYKPIKNVEEGGRLLRPEAETVSSAWRLSLDSFRLPQQRGPVGDDGGGGGRWNQPRGGFFGHLCTPSKNLFSLLSLFTFLFCFCFPFCG